MTSIKKNLAYSSLLTVSSYLFPLITFPYVTRVLGVSNLGICNFVDSVVQYFIVFSMLGISTVGIREVARVRADKEALSRVFSSLLVLNLISSIIAIIVLLIGTLFVPKLHMYSNMFYIGSAKILAYTLLIEWFFKGLEEFRYITIRSIIVRSLYVLAVLLFVKKADDYVVYFFLTTLMFVVNSIINLKHSRKYARFSLKEIDFRPFIKPFIVLGTYLILTSMYTTFNVIYLGFVSGTDEVGYYTTATKLYTIIMSLFTAFTGVMLPRMSSLLSKGDTNEFKRLTRKSVEALFVFSIPLIVISEVCTSQIISIIAGPGYQGSVTPMRIVMPLMLVIGYEQIIVYQMLSPMKKDSAILINSIVGAIVGVLFNIILVPKYGSIGTSFVWLFSELSVMFTAQYFIIRYMGYHMPLFEFGKRVVLVAPLFFVLFFVSHMFSSNFVSLLSVSIITVLYCFLMEFFVLKNNLLRNSVSSIMSKLSNTK